MPDPFIIMSAPNGARRQKLDHPILPITPAELAECAKQIVAQGASILHLHVRDKQNQHSLDVEQYRSAISAIRASVGDQLLIQVTSEAVGKYTRFEQMQMVRDLKPEAVSLALREICPSEKELPEAAEFISWMQEERVFPQYILYDQSDIGRFTSLLARGVIETQFPFVLLVIGRKQSSQIDSNLERAKMLDAALELPCPWAICGFGLHEKQCVSFATENAGHIRVGFENNILRNDQDLLQNNAEMIGYCAEIAKTASRPVASIDDVRSMFHLE
ncbi:MAG: class III aminotransferase [Robiginitomaculum sp.]|nr:MAG: class III aminotransferase [Robiginitomaculum sp.]